MKPRTLLGTVMLVIALGLVLPAWAPAAVVGHITQVEGRVDILKGGKLPSTPVKLQDGVEIGDVLRTKSLSKAQITFIDSSVITMAPETRLAIDDYQFDPVNNKRNAVLQLFQGLAQVAVNKLFKVEEPDFVVKTHTAVTGVRGTDFGIRLEPNSSTILNFQGLTRVANIFPEITAWMKRARIIAYGGKTGAGLFPPGSFVDLKVMQGTTVPRGLPPTLPFTISLQEKLHFMNLMAPALKGSQPSQGTGAGERSSISSYDPGQGSSVAGTASTTSVPALAPLSGTTDTGTGNTQLALLNAITVPPTVVPQTETQSTTVTPVQPIVQPILPVTPQLLSYTIMQQSYAASILISSYPYNTATLYTYGWGQRTGVYDGYYYSLGEATRSAPSGQTNYYSPSTAGTSSGTATGTVTGYSGQALTGAITYTGTNSAGNTIYRTGTITINPTGAATYTWSDTVTTSGGQAAGTGAGTTNQYPGTYFSQTASGTMAGTSNAPYSQQTAQNSGIISGTQTGVQAGNFRASLAVNSTADPNTFPSSFSQPTSFSSQGVVNTATGQGNMTLVANNTAQGQVTAGGPITMRSDGTLIGRIVGGQYASTSNYVNSAGMWAQTSNTAAQPFTQTSWGSATLTPGTSTPTATFSGTAWGQLNISGGTNTYNTGPIAGSLTDSTGQPFSSGQITLNQIIAGVVTDAGGGTQTGVAQGIGQAQLGTGLMTQGTVSLNSAGNVTYNYSGNAVTHGSSQTITGGSMIHQPGTYFTQTATGTVTASSSAPYQVQNLTNAATITGSRSGGPAVVPGNFNISSSNLQITNTGPSNISNIFPAGSNNLPVTLNTQGVIKTVPPATTGGSGAMTVTLTSGTTPLGTLNGAVTIQPNGNLSAPQLTGVKRVLTPGGNRVPIRQAGTVNQVQQ